MILTGKEQFEMWIGHEIGYLSDLNIPETKEVIQSMIIAGQKVRGEAPSLHLLKAYVDPKEVEQQLTLAIRDLELDGVTPGELYKAVVEALERFVEFRLEHIYDFLLHSSEEWTERAIRKAGE